jgi:hypothetical protein
MAGQPIPIATANKMIKDYLGYMASLGVDMHDQTQSVSFSSAELMAWLNDVMPSADELRIFMGCYPAGQPNAGRTTLILWPYRSGAPAMDSGFAAAGIEPFNEGTREP